MKRFNGAVTIVGLLLMLALSAPAQAASFQVPNNLPTGSVDGPWEKCPRHRIVVIPGGVQTVSIIPSNVPVGGYTDIVAERYRNTPGVDVFYVSYDALPFVAGTYYDVRERGLSLVRESLARLAEQCPTTDLSLFGFSLGADIAARIASEIGAGNGPIPREQFLAAAFLSNPNRGPGIAHAGSAPGGGSGFFGPLSAGYGTVQDRVIDVCDFLDVVCDSTLPVNSLRHNADTLSQTPTDQLLPEVTRDERAFWMYLELPLAALGALVHANSYQVTRSYDHAFAFLDRYLV